MAKNQGGVSPTVAGIAGAAAGAALGIALSNSNVQKKMAKAAKDIREEGVHKFDQLKQTVQGAGEEAQEKVEKGKQVAQKNLEKAKKQV